MSWQQAHIHAAATYLREKIAAGTSDARTRSVYEGLLEVLDPSRRATRMRRELAESTKVVPVLSVRDRRAPTERRAQDRRRVDLGLPDGSERRIGAKRRSGRDRRDD